METNLPFWITNLWTGFSMVGDLSRGYSQIGWNFSIDVDANAVEFELPTT